MEYFMKFGMRRVLRAINRFCFFIFRKHIFKEKCRHPGTVNTNLEVAVSMIIPIESLSNVELDSRKQF